jgi:hypothetical protein
MRRGVKPMVFSALACLLAGAPPTFAAAKDTMPIFSPAANVGWISYGPDFIPEPTGPQPVTFDPAHPFVENGIEYNAARPGTKDESVQSTFPVADLSNPVLQPWAREELRKLYERVLAGGALFSRQTSCWPMGVPGFLLYVVNPIFFLQTPKEVVLLATADHMVRHIHMNVPHSKNPKPSWFGESIGHYEADSLVVDTIGVTTKAFIDNYRTPHSDRLHVVERFRMIDDGKTLEVRVHIEDPDALSTPLDVSQRYVRSDRAPLNEQVCAENTANYFNYEIDPLPQTEKPDF